MDIAPLAHDLDVIATRLASTVPQETSTTSAAPISSASDAADALPGWLRGTASRTWLPHKERRREWVAPAARTAFLSAVRGKTSWPLYFYGLQGRGKSTAALWFLDHVIRGIYLTAREIVDIEFGGDWAMKQRLRESWSRADLVVIDQFGMAGKQGPGQTQVLVDAIDKREGRPLILVSNIPPHDLSEVYDAQIQSRVAAGTKVEFKGPDYRTQRTHG